MKAANVGHSSADATVSATVAGRLPGWQSLGGFFMHVWVSRQDH